MWFDEDFNKISAEDAQGDWCDICKAYIPTSGIHNEHAHEEVAIEKIRQSNIQETAAMDSYLNVSSNNDLTHFSVPNSPETLCGKPVVRVLDKPLIDPLSLTELYCDTCQEAKPSASIISIGSHLTDDHGVDIQLLEDVAAFHAAEHKHGMVKHVHSGTTDEAKCWKCDGTGKCDLVGCNSGCNNCGGSGIVGATATEAISEKHAHSDVTGWKSITADITAYAIGDSDDVYCIQCSSETLASESPLGPRSPIYGLGDYYDDTATCIRCASIICIGCGSTNSRYGFDECSNVYCPTNEYEFEKEAGDWSVPLAKGNDWSVPFIPTKMPATRQMSDCSHCAGSGAVRTAPSMWPGDNRTTLPCAHCSATGKCDCSECNTNKQQVFAHNEHVQYWVCNGSGYDCFPERNRLFASENHALQAIEDSTYPEAGLWHVVEGATQCPLHGHIAQVNDDEHEWWGEEWGEDEDDDEVRQPNYYQCGSCGNQVAQADEPGRDKWFDISRPCGECGSNDWITPEENLENTMHEHGHPEWQGTHPDDKFDDDEWNVVQVPHTDYAEEGRQMQHSLGEAGSGPETYPDVYSLRDSDNKPHVTFTRKPDGSIDEAHGKAGTFPKSEHLDIINRKLTSSKTADYTEGEFCPACEGGGVSEGGSICKQCFGHGRLPGGAQHMVSGSATHSHNIVNLSAVSDKDVALQSELVKHMQSDAHSGHHNFSKEDILGMSLSQLLHTHTQLPHGSPLSDEQSNVDEEGNEIAPSIPAGSCFGEFKPGTDECSTCGAGRASHESYYELMGGRKIAPELTATAGRNKVESDACSLCGSMGHTENECDEWLNPTIEIAPDVYPSEVGRDRDQR